MQQPYGWWKFDDNGNDSSAQTALHNATVTNATYVMGLSGSALQFNGSSSKVTFTSNPSLSSSTTNFTVGAWIKTTATAAGVIIQQRGASSGQYQLSTTAGGAVQFWLRSNSSTYQFNLTSTQTVNDGQWHFIVGVRSGTTGYIYIDGANVKSASGTTRNLSSNNAVSIGADAYGSSLWFNGTIDDARIYSSALSASVIAGMANQPPSVATPASATPSAVTGTTTNLSVLGADNSGEANCYYVWSATTLPTGAAAPTYSVNGTNAAKNTTATFSKAGTYVFTVSIYNNQSGLAAISSVSVTVSQTLTAVVVTPGSASIMSGATQQFTAAAVDQFSQSMATQPTFTWTTTVGTIDATGLLTAPTILATGTVTATAGSLSGTASVSVTTLPTPINDPELNALASTLYADGSLSRNDMMQILLKAGTDNGVVDATELADLQRIVANSTAYHMANYVEVLAGDVVNGNAANAHYQGATLGNLVAGSTSTKMNNLVDKWFLGSRSPNGRVQLSEFLGIAVRGRANLHRPRTKEDWATATSSPRWVRSPRVRPPPFRTCSSTTATTPGPSASTTTARPITSPSTVTCRPAGSYAIYERRARLRTPAAATNCGWPWPRRPTPSGTKPARKAATAEHLSQHRGRMDAGPSANRCSASASTTVLVDCRLNQKQTLDRRHQRRQGRDLRHQRQPRRRPRTGRTPTSC